MDNTRSLASRFSGLLLFLMSLVVVGVLVYLTINSARDDDANTETSTTQTQREDEAVADEDNAAETTGGQTSSTSDDGANQVAGSTDTPDNLATTGGDDLPNTGPESAVFATIGLVGLAYAGNAYLDSRRQLKILSQR